MRSRAANNDKLSREFKTSVVYGGLLEHNILRTNEICIVIYLVFFLRMFLLSIRGKHP